jgi:hypothetical protein
MEDPGFPTPLPLFVIRYPEDGAVALKHVRINKLYDYIYCVHFFHLIKENQVIQCYILLP